MTQPLNGIAATMFHGEGAIAQCGHCKRYTLDRTALADFHMDTATNEVDAEGRDGVADYDAVLSMIGGALAALSAPQGVPQPADAGVWEVARYGYFKDDTFIEVSVENEDALGCRWVGGLHDAELARAVLKLTATPAAPKQAEAWQPIETAPKDGTLILLRESYEEEPFIGRWYDFLSRWCASTTHYDTDGNACVVDRVYSEGVTHWMPIPSAPAAPQE